MNTPPASKILGLFRHAKSDWTDPRARDFDRVLNARGRRGAVAMGQHIHAHGQAFDRVLASPAVRSAQTIELAVGAAEAAGHGGFPIVWDRRIYLASSASLIDLLREQDDALGAILMVGHNPGLEDVIFDLVPDDGTSPLRDRVEEKFPTAAFAILLLGCTRWSDLAEGSAELVHLMRPRDIDAEFGPEEE